jgi:hypothetical protein
LAAVRRYREIFPNRRIPHRSGFVRIDRQLREFGHINVSSIDIGRPRLDNGELDKQVLNLAHEDPKVANRSLDKSELQIAQFGEF